MVDCPNKELLISILNEFGKLNSEESPVENESSINYDTKC